MEENIAQTLQALITSRMTAQAPHVPDVDGGEGTPFVLVPTDYSVHDPERLLPRPTRKRGTVVLLELASFIGFVNQEKTDATRIYCVPTDAPSFTAVFNDHAQVDGDHTPGWCDYRAHYACPLSAEWKAWTAQSGKHMTQELFAQFIENNLPDLAEPPAADMLEISRTLEAKKKVNFASGIRLSNGQNELTFEEEISGTAAKGKFQVPEVFKIGIPVFYGSERWAMEARLRYRIADGGKLTMWFELVRPHAVLDEAINDVRKDITEGTGLLPFAGRL